MKMHFAPGDVLLKWAYNIYTLVNCLECACDSRLLPRLYTHTLSLSLSRDLWSLYTCDYNRRRERSLYSSLIYCGFAIIAGNAVRAFNAVARADHIHNTARAHRCFIYWTNEKCDKMRSYPKITLKDCFAKWRYTKRKSVSDFGSRPICSSPSLVALSLSSECQ